MKNILADHRPGWRGLIAAHRSWLAFLIPALTLAAACSGDSVDLSVLDCSLLAKDRPYRYRTVSTFDLAARPPGAPPEQVQDYGPEPFKFTREFEGAVQAPDRLEAVIRQDSSLDLMVRVIGGQAWTRTVNDPTGAFQAWRSTPIETAGELFTPERICAQLSNEISLDGADGQQDATNGIETVHYTLPSVGSQLPAALYGPQSDFAHLISTLDVDVWLNERNGHPIRFSLQGTGHYENERALTLTILSEIIQVRDGSIEIDPP